MPPHDFDTFYVTHFARLSATMRLVVNDAQAGEDLAQEAFVRAYERWHRVQGLERPEAWLFTTAYNLARRRWTRVLRRERVSSIETIDLTGRSGEVEPDREAQLDLRRALAALPQKQRAVVVLRHVLGYSTEDTAALLRMSVPNVRVTLHRARHAIRTAGGTPEAEAPPSDEGRRP